MARLRKKKANVTIKLRAEASPELKLLNRRLQRMTADRFVAMLKQTLADSVMKEIEKRYGAVALQLPEVYRIKRKTRVDFSDVHAKRRLRRIQRDISELQDKYALGYEEQSKRIKAAQKELDDVLKKFLRTRSKTGYSRKGRIGPALRKVERLRLVKQGEVMRLLLNRTKFHVTATTGSVTIGAGNRAALNEIETPSLTTILSKGARTSLSPFKQLWQQMEYGSGLLRKPAPLNSGTEFKDPIGSWWYGNRAAGSGIHFLGSKPGNFLRDRTGLMYQSDSVKLASVFQRNMLRLLFGVA